MIYNAKPSSFTSFIMQLIVHSFQNYFLENTEEQ